MPSPPPPAPAVQTAAALLAQGRPDEAVARLATLTAQAPTYAAAHALHATALEAAGRPDDALAAWGRVAALVPRSPLARRERARLLSGRQPAAAAAAPAAAPTAERADDELAWSPQPDWLADAEDPPDAEREDEHGARGPSEVAAGPEPARPAASGPETSPPDAERADDWIVLPEGAGLPAPLPDPDVSEPSGAPPSVADELDSLISQLEGAPRIRPDPSFNGPAVSLDTGDVDEMASETLAKIYAAQGRYAEAAAVYDTLAVRQPDRADELRALAEEMRQKKG
jgi:tetratricopeptide (TPR) repeat protein